MAQLGPDYLVRRGGVWHYVRRVPLEFAALDKRGIVKISTGIKVGKDPRCIIAGPIAAKINISMEAYWRDLAAGGDRAKLALEFAEAQKAAKKLGLNPPISDMNGRTFEQMFNRLETLLGSSVPHPGPEGRAAAMAGFDVVKMPDKTFEECAAIYVEKMRPKWKGVGEKTYKQWKQTLKDFAYPVIGDTPVSELSGVPGTKLILQILEPIWPTKTHTAAKLRGRIEEILDWAKFEGYRSGDNPAAWEGHLDKTLLDPETISPTVNHPAMKAENVPDFLTKVRRETKRSAKALEFTILAAGRSSETLLALKTEIDREARMWTIPKARMKAKRDHSVPLTAGMIAILDSIPNTPGNKYLFEGHRPGGALANNSMRVLIREMGVPADEAVTHGFRSTFRDWGGDETRYPADLLELAIAHAVGDKTERAYRRGSGLKKRHQLMADWEEFCNTGKVPQTAKLGGLALEEFQKGAAA